MTLGKKFLSNSLLYAIAGGLGRGLPFLLVPVLTSYLSVDDYGRFGLLVTFVGLLAIIIGMNPHLYIISHFFRLERSVLGLRVFNIIILGLVTLLPTVVIYWLLNTYVIESLFGFGVFLIALTVSFNRFLANLLLSIIQMEKRADLFFIYYACMSIVVVTAVLVIALFGELLWTTLMIAEGVVTIILNFILVNRMFKLGYIVPKYDVDSFKDVSLFSAPLLVHVLSLWVIGYADRFILAEITDVASVGVYTLASTLGLGFSLVHESVFRAIQPTLYKRLNEGNSESKIVRYIWLYYAISIIGAVLYSIIGMFGMEHYLDASYMRGIEIFPLVILGYMFLGMYRVVAVFLYHNKDTVWLTKITALTAIISILLNLVLVPEYGMRGTAVAMAISFGLLFLFVKILITKLYKISWVRFI